MTDARPARLAPLAGARRKILLALGLLVAIFFAWLVVHRPYPSDRTPEGAYLRIVRSITDDRENEAFPYLETEAQWACYTIRDMRKKSLARVDVSFPEPERTTWMRAYKSEADAADGSDVFALVAKAHGWRARLRRDLSGVASVEVQGEHASVVTARGTRYPFRRRDNGIWGLTMFTGDLLAEAERASRDYDMITKAADDYDRSR